LIGRLEASSVPSGVDFKYNAAEEPARAAIREMEETRMVKEKEITSRAIGR
jgi:hypothetical protein